MGASRVPPKTLPMLLRPALSCLLLAAASLAPASSHAEPSTTGAGAAALVSEAERSGFQRTGRYEEVARLAAAFQARYPDKVAVRSFGTTPEGRPMQLLVVTATGAFDPADAKVDEVLAYVSAADDAEKARVLEAEKAGKGRKKILAQRED